MIPYIAKIAYRYLLLPTTRRLLSPPLWQPFLILNRGINSFIHSQPIDNHILVIHFMLVFINLYYLTILPFIPNLTSLLSALTSPNSLPALLHSEWYRKLNTP